MPLVGGMMLLVGIELGKVVVELRGWKLWLALFTAALSLATNMAVGFAVGLAISCLVRALVYRHLLFCSCRGPRFALKPPRLSGEGPTCPHPDKFFNLDFGHLDKRLVMEYNSTAIESVP